MSSAFLGPFFAEKSILTIWAEIGIKQVDKYNTRLTIFYLLHEIEDDSDNVDKEEGEEDYLEVE